MQSIFNSIQDLLKVSGNEVLYFYQSFFAVVCHLICSNSFHKATDHSAMIVLNNENRIQKTKLKVKVPNPNLLISLHKKVFLL